MRSLVPKRLRSERLDLRVPEEVDLETLNACYRDAEVVRYTVGRVLTEAEVWRMLCTMLGHWRLRGYGPYAIVERATERTLGTAGFWYPIDWPGPEIKWTLAREHWGNGFAREAAQQVLEAAAAHLPGTVFLSLIHPDNDASIRVAEALGARVEKRACLHDVEHLVYRHAAGAA